MKNLVLGVMLLSCVLNVQAANIYDLDVGDGVYLQGMLSDELVYVLRIDTGSNRVKIRRRTDGTTKWINPSKLISREASTRNDVGRTVAVIGLAVCAFNPDACKNKANRHSQRNALQNTKTTTGYKFKITNNCRHSIKFAMHYRNQNGKWNTIGWWGLNGKQNKYLKFKDGSYASSNNSVFYYYAEASDKSFEWNSGKHHYAVNGRKVAMSRVEDKSGDSELTLSCAGW